MDLNDGVQVNVDPMEEDALGPGLPEYESDEAEQNETIAFNESNVACEPKPTNAKINFADVTDDGDFNVAEYQAILKDKTLMRVFDHLLKEKVEKAKEEILASTTRGGVSGENGKEVNRSNVNGNATRTFAQNDKVNYLSDPIRINQNQILPVVKSPSDTTLYAPAVKEAQIDMSKFESVVMPPNPTVQTGRGCRAEGNDANQADLIKKISDFVDSIRVSEKDRNEAGGSGQGVNSTELKVTDERAAYCAAK